MDEIDGLACKLMEVFEALEDLLLEELAVPEDLNDPEGSVDLWVASDGVRGEQEISVRGRISLPTTVALTLSAQELAELLWEELLGSVEFKEAALVAHVVGRTFEERSVPSPEDASLN